MKESIDIETQAGSWTGEDAESGTLNGTSVRGSNSLPSPVTSTATTITSKNHINTSRVREYLRHWFPSPDQKAEKREALRVNTLKLRDCRPGYPRLAAFLDSDDNFMIYRRFGYVQARLLLEKQNELQHLEDELKELDEELDDEQPGCLNRADMRYDPPSERVQFMRTLMEKYTEYAQLVATAKELTSTARPARSAYRSLRYFISNTRPLCQKDEPWVECEEDMITLRPGRERAWLDDFLEHCLKFVNHRWLNDLFTAHQTREKTEGLVEQQSQEGLVIDPKRGCPVYYTRSRIEKLTTTILTITIMLLLGVPIFVLYHLTTSKDQGTHTVVSCIGTLMVFTLAFSAVLALFTKARRHEILGAAAAYCAVLVVFLSNVPTSSLPALH